MISWNEFIDSLKGEVQDKSKNPFFGAFIATWSIRHWEAIFIVLNFDKDFTLDKKIEKINTYFGCRPDGDFWITIGLTFLVILFGYIFLNIARILSNVSEKIITPLIYKWTAGKASIVTKDTYDQALKWEKNAKDRLELQIEENSKLRKEIEEWENRYNNINKELLNRIENSEDYESTHDSKDKANINDENKNIEKSNYTDNLDSMTLALQEVYKSLIDTELGQKFLNISTEIKLKNTLDINNKYVQKSIQLDLIELDPLSNLDSKFRYFSLTKKGKELATKLAENYT